MQDCEGYDIEIVVCSEGIKIYRDKKRLNVFAWYDYLVLLAIGINNVHAVLYCIRPLILGSLFLFWLTHLLLMINKKF
jgi:hypothetical protein